MATVPPPPSLPPQATSTPTQIKQKNRFIVLPRHLAWQPGDLGVLRGVEGGVAEEARTRGIASLSLDRFAFFLMNETTPMCVVCLTSLVLVRTNE